MMKRLNYTVAVIMLAIGLLISNSCTEKDEGPTISWKTGTGYTTKDVTINQGEFVLVGITAFKSATSNKKLKKFTLSAVTTGATNTMVDSIINADSFTANYSIGYGSPGTSRLVAKIVADGGMSAEVSFAVTVNPGGVTVRKKSGVILGSWNDETGSFYNTADELVYTRIIAAQNQSKVDFLFFKGTTTGNTVAATDDDAANAISDFQLASWTTKRQTRFNTTTITAGQFDAIGSLYLFPTFNSANALTRINQLTEGQVFMFKTQAGKQGLVKVVQLYRGDKIKFDAIVQQ